MIAYLDTPSGISGDIFLGCLLDAGWPLDRLHFAIAQLRLPANEYSIDARTIMKGPLRATLADVQTSESSSHRHLADIQKIIESSDLPQIVKQNALATFSRLADAEAKVHGTTRDKIHFHEVGAMDAIIDIVGTCAGIHDLGIEKLHASTLPLGPGWTKSEHGQIPLPAPATLELLAAAKAPTRPAPGPGEWVTPTGAALVCTLATFSQPPMQLEKIGTGAGTKDAPWPNVARLWLGTPLPTSGGDLVQLETNIDDMNPQLYAAVSEKLFAAGAKDVWFTPIQMKKNRPAVLLSALGPRSHEAALSNIILEETTTLGVRMHPLEQRHEARREMRQIQTSHGAVRIKLKFLNDKCLGANPEYDDCKALAETSNLPVRIIWEEALAAARQFFPPAQSHPHNS
ncbi:MAG TPA: nickel pincer cofactor biosynthesis protein LarC [Phycisphaerae bacterium]|nr:nickel pincer cofactor biosynthesis protein LarC [Phycisphaerae bacterium]